MFNKGTLRNDLKILISVFIRCWGCSYEYDRY